ncbi:MAG: LacI family transcriptional regulator [Blastochloris sp.]|nr:LacI family transcriptional regulator [Blastochloris sp.]
MAASSSSTLRDVARIAGVSISTASQALRNRPNVAPETRERVLEVAATLGYQQQVRIPSSMTTTLSVVGVLTRTTPDMPMLINPFYSHVIMGIERECQRFGISMMYANMEADTLNRPLTFPPMLQGNQVDGLLIVGALLPEVIAELADRPVVLVDAYAPGQTIDSVVSDNFNGAFAAVSHLIERGHHRIGLIGTMENSLPKHP